MTTSRRASDVDPSEHPKKIDVVPALKRTVTEFLQDKGTDLAGALTYYAVLSLFPAILALTSLLGVFGQGPSTTQAMLDVTKELGVAEDSLAPVETFVEDLQRSDGASIALFIGLATALFAASNYVNAFSRMMNTVYGVEEGRPIWKLRPWLVLITFICLLLAVAVALSLVFTGSIVDAVGSVIGLGDTFVTVWTYAKWPVMLLIVMFVVGLLYWGTPNVKQQKFRWLSAGAVVAIIGWGIGTFGFFFYVSNFGSYNATYGALAGIIVLLVWLWLTNIFLVLGAELDSELQRARQLRLGIAAEKEIQLPYRDSSGVEKKEEKEREKTEEARRIRIEAAARRAGSDGT
ncbi:MAG TPA: YihY/virulence factor BrkB family protein [Ornithinimicrobium sp.]|uniref:YihY/virulence factor BrkB family protein n=1 Tax=Ornithinimicrobium sp. TaxID=1977084 RepID=UPI002B49029A|nr:YihY/virulence factor BrkB family protein [Ornithinimicrobium sp.]HKJ12289.1 YihY/virulence factor BrkB family protein [Ornithinimicrobium sp.]